MDSVNGINTAKATDVKTVENQKNGLDKNAFLQLLVTQMQYQDPLEPVNTRSQTSLLAVVPTKRSPLLESVSVVKYRVS